MPWDERLTAEDLDEGGLRFECGVQNAELTVWIVESTLAGSAEEDDFTTYARAAEPRSPCRCDGELALVEIGRWTLKRTRSIARQLCRALLHEPGRSVLDIIDGLLGAAPQDIDGALVSQSGK